MGRAVAIARLDLTAEELRGAASVEKDGAAARRILALALILEGVDRTSAARICGMDRQTLRDWVHRYNDEGGAGLICAMRSSDALGSKCMNVRSARSWRPWVTAVCPCAHNIPKAILRPRRLLKKLRGDPGQRNPRDRKRKAARNLVSGRSAFRSTRHADPCVGQTRHASARAARPTL